MALISCHECSKEISDKAPACPHCGVPSEDRPVQCYDCKRSITSATSYGFQSFPLCRDCDRKVRSKDKQRRNKEHIEADNRQIAKDRATTPEGLKKDGQGKDEDFGWYGIGAVACVIGVQSGLVGDISMAVYEDFGELASLLVAGLIAGGLFIGPKWIFGRDE